MKIVATTSLPAVNRPNADRWNAARSRQKWISLASIVPLALVQFEHSFPTPQKSGCSRKDFHYTLLFLCKVSGFFFDEKMNIQYLT